MIANLGDCFAPAVNIHRRNCLQVGGVDIHAVCVKGVCAWQVTDGGFVGLGGAVEAFENPFENTAVFAIARPHEAAVFVAAEPVDEEDLWQFAGIGFCSYLQPMLEVVGHVVAAERKHGRGNIKWYMRIGKSVMITSTQVVGNETIKTGT